MEFVWRGGLWYTTNTFTTFLLNTNTFTTFLRALAPLLPRETAPRNAPPLAPLIASSRGKFCYLSTRDQVYVDVLRIKKNKLISFIFLIENTHLTSH